MLRNVNLTVLFLDQEAGHSGRARPGPIPNPEVKPAVAAVLLTYVSGWEAAVLALDTSMKEGKLLCYEIGSIVVMSYNMPSQKWLPTNK